jgi:hypothetical protein
MGNTPEQLIILIAAWITIMFIIYISLITEAQLKGLFESIMICVILYECYFFFNADVTYLFVAFV